MGAGLLQHDRMLLAVGDGPINSAPVAEVHRVEYCIGELFGSVTRIQSVHLCSEEIRDLHPFRRTEDRLAIVFDQFS